MNDRSTSFSLLERVRRQDRDSWHLLFYLYSPLVGHWLQTWGVNEDDSEDLRQEVFQAVATGLRSFRQDRPGDTFRGWLRTITRHKFLDHCRRQNRQPTAAGGSSAQQQLLQVPTPADAEETDSPTEVRRLHHRALELVRSEFEDRTWQAFWRCAVEGVSPLEVGALMGMSAAAVRQAKSRVLRRLKEELGDLLG